MQDFPSTAWFRAATAAALCALAGCASAPSSPSASVTVPDTWSLSVPATADAAGSQAAAWWREFGSAELGDWVEMALKAHPDVRVAAARVAQARALTDGAQGDRMPQVGLTAGAQRGRASAADPKAVSTFAGLRASWEADLFSGKALAGSAAAHDARAAAFALQAARVALVAEVVTAYGDIQGLLRQEGVAREAVATLERQIGVANRRFAAGHVGTLDIDRLVSELRQEHAHMQQLRGALQVRQRQVAVLLGTTQVPALQAWAGWDRSGAGHPARLLPAELLERRPDVQRHAQALEAATARVGVARSDLYPRLQFDWAGRKERLSVQSAGAAATTVVLGYGVSLSLPIFDGGRIRANIALHEARVQEAMADYEKAMLGALADVEIAFAQLHAAQGSVAELERALDAAAGASRKCERLFEAGVTDLNTVLDVRRNHLRAQDALLQARSAHWAAAVAVRRAFAGEV
jgi:NodT family efflux transporter outer membrane factor (OMF) lipoprotein